MHTGNAIRPEVLKIVTRNPDQYKRALFRFRISKSEKSRYQFELIYILVLRSKRLKKRKHFRLQKPR